MKAAVHPTILGAAAVCVTLWAPAALAVPAYGPICDTNAKVSCPSGSVAGILEVSNNTCNSWNHRAMLAGSYYYKYYGGCANTCSGNSCNGGAGNYFVVTGSSGWDFRQLHFSSNSNSYSRTCDRCALGLIGGTGSVTSARSRSDNRQYGTRKTAWYSGSVSCGSGADCNIVVGHPTL